MQVREIMSKNPQFIAPQTTVADAAKKMRELDAGSIPVGENDRLVGFVTDRDITVRGVAEGIDPEKTDVRKVMSEGVFYIYDTDDISKANSMMREKQVRRLIVLNSDKRMVGIVSLGDLAREVQDEAFKGEAAEGIFKDRS